MPRIQDPTPAWLKPENASVLDSPMTKALRKLATLIGANDPQSQVLALMNPLVPEGQATLSAPLQAIAKKIRAWHGSPHDFERFSLSKIGTGEGTQAYGHGLYFAENEGVAKSYRDALGGGVVNKYKPSDDIETQIVQGYFKQYGNKADAVAAMSRDLSTSERPSGSGARWYDALARARRGLEAESIAPGRMYEVEIAADPDTLLDWDKPLSQQSERVQQALRGESIPKVNSFLGGMRGRSYMDADVAPHFTGADLVEHLRASGMAKESSDVLKSAGIPGIKYLDGGSRGAGEGTRNYVIFDDSLVSILKKYGVALPMIEGLRRKAQANNGRLPASDVEGLIQQ